MLSVIKNRLISLLQFLLVATYIIFEELIWERIAQPIYETIHSLKILERAEVKLQTINPLAILSIFVVLLVSVEIFGIYAGILFVSGQVFLGALLYLSKIPVAAFTFWLFRVTEDKLMLFGWFKWGYDWIMRGIDWLKSCEAYKQTKERLAAVKLSIKNAMREIKERYFSGKSVFIVKIKNLYKTVKESLQK